MAVRHSFIVPRLGFNVFCAYEFRLPVSKIKA
jgi:hypothetical protein